MELRPIIGITMGDPYGNGPEITLKALADEKIYNRCRPIVIGDFSSMSYAQKVFEKIGGSKINLHIIHDVKEAKFEYGTIDLFDMHLVPENEILETLNEKEPKPFGIGASKIGGEASFQYVKKVIELAMNHEIDATVTNALSKEAINMAGHHYSGHTEIYADYTRTKKYTMMLAHENLRVVHVSTHVSLRDACDRVKKERVLECIRIADEGCKALGIKNPKIGVMPYFKDDFHTKRLLIRGLSDQSHHNACGLGLADITTRRCLNSVDWESTWVNLTTNTMIEGGKIPMYQNNDFDAIRVAIRTCTKIQYRNAKIVRIKDTLALDEFEVSDTLLPEINGNSEIEILSDPYDLVFDKDGYLKDFE